MLRSETAHDPARQKAALAGLKAYQKAARPHQHVRGEIVANVGRATLRRYGEGGRPVIFVPSLINGPEVLDLTAENSMMQWLAAQGLQPYLVEWGTPQPDERGLSITGHVETYLLPLIDTVGPDAALAGYCLGGTMAMAAATIRPPSALILVAAPWDYRGFSSQTRDGIRHLWNAAAPVAESMGLVPAELLQQLFWRIDSSRTIRKFEEFATKDPASIAGLNYIAVEDWANRGPPLTYAAGRELFEDLMIENASGEGRWQIDGRTIDPAALSIPILNILSTTDRITPAESGWDGGERIELAQGHVGMVVGSRARESLWKMLFDWVSQVRNNC
jgi:polyhydroxyalkanoate synthase